MTQSCLQKKLKTQCVEAKRTSFDCTAEGCKAFVRVEFELLSTTEPANQT